MRELILRKLNVIAEKTNDFDDGSMRWRHFRFQDKKVDHMFKYEDLHDSDLLSFYEKVVIQLNKGY
jgi:hypothetical protein